MSAAEKPSRRRLLSGAVAAAGGALAAPALGQSLMEWRMATAWPRGLAGPGAGAQRLADRIGLLTDGKLLVRLYPVGDLVAAEQAMDAVGDGRIEMLHDTAGYHLAKSPAFAFFAGMPLGLTVAEHRAWLVAGGGQAVWDELGARFGVKALLAGALGPQLGGWFRRELTTVEDLKGLRMRIPGLAGQALARLGAVQRLLPADAAATALRDGTLDAAVFMGPANDEAFGLAAAAPVCHWPGFQDPCLAFQLQINKARFDALPVAHRSAIEAACAEETLRMQAEADIRNAATLARLAAGGTVRFVQVPAEVFTAFGGAVAAVLGDMIGAGDDLLRRIASSALGTRDRALLWTRLGEQGYANMRLLAADYPKG